MSRALVSLVGFERSGTILETPARLRALRRTALLFDAPSHQRRRGALSRSGRGTALPQRSAGAFQGKLPLLYGDASPTGTIASGLAAVDRASARSAGRRRPCRVSRGHSAALSVRLI